MKTHRENEGFPVGNRFEKNRKKLLTNESGRDKISELPLRTTATKETLIFDK